ncbi:MAG: DNA polymerase Y family protein [Alphaproteobacteria bacterium]|nr:DNA polymerase Y family protein [Alphaproteobacteria bacterium]
MKRFVHLWFPYWPIERMRRVRPRDISNDRPLVLVTSGGRGIEITAVNEQAVAQGLWVGQGLADARALLPGLVSLQAAPQADAVALAALAQWCGRYGSQRNAHDDCGIWIDVSGVAHLYGGEAGLLADAVRRLQGFGLTVRAGIADTPAAAYALARFAVGGGAQAQVFSSIAAGALRAGLAGFPVEALRLDADAVLLLKRLGLKRIGQLYDIPRASLQRRFNETHFGRGKSARDGRARSGKAKKQELAGSVVVRLDQALGGVLEPLKPLAEPPVLSVRQSWTDPLISAEGIATEAGVLAARLVAQLSCQGLGCRHVRLSLYRSDGTAAIMEAGTSRACRDGDHLMGLLAEKFATIDAGFGIDVAELACVLAEPMQVTQERLGVGDGGGGGDEARALTLLVDRLVSRLGQSRVRMLELCESHIPERAARFVPARETVGRRGVRAGGMPASVGELAKPPRPLLLLSPPEPIDVFEGGIRGRPGAFVWRRMHNRIASCEGPERIAPEWWRDIGRAGGRQSRERDYFRVEVQGGARFWIFHELAVDEEASLGVAGGRGRWLMHGLYGGGS